VKHGLIAAAFVALMPMPVYPQALSDGKYVDLAGSEDYYVILKGGVIVDAECNGPPCDLPATRRGHAAKHKILATNSIMSTLLVQVPYGHVYAFCREDKAPNSKRGDVHECDFNRGWSK
jgi:hypothetical protein